MAAKSGPNEILIGGAAYLLTETGGGTAVHLTGGAARPAEARGAVDGFYFDDDWPGSLGDRYDREKLLDRIWAATTLCGRDWARMAAGDGGPFENDGEVVYAPTCRRCLMIMDRSLPGPEPDRRIHLLADLVADAVIEFGMAEVDHVPDDQQQLLRRAVRRSLRRRTDERVQTFYRSNAVHVISEEIYKEHELEYSQEAAAALDQYLATGERPDRAGPEWRLSWDAWDIS